jgi:hypothetical protein
MVEPLYWVQGCERFASINELSVACEVGYIYASALFALLGCIV